METTGAWPAWPGEVSEGALVRRFGEATLARARVYAAGGHVTSVTSAGDGYLVLALVAGTAPSDYQVLLQRLSGPGEGLAYSARCSCPVRADCKHAAAVLLTVRDRVAPPAPRAWREALESVVAGRDGSPDDAGGGGGPSVAGRRLGIVLEVRSAPAQWGHPPSAQVTILGVRESRAGLWSRNTSWDMVSAGYPTPVEPRHRALATELVRLRDALQTDHSYTGGTPRLDLLGPAGWDWLRRALAAGVAVVDPSGRGPELSLEPVEPVLEVTRGPDGITVVPRLEGVADGTTVEAIGEPPTGLVLRRPGPDGPWLGVRPLALRDPAAYPLVSGGPLAVPAEDVGGFLADYLPGLGRVIEVTSPDGSVDVDARPGPRLQLRVGPDRAGDRPIIIVRWGIVYALPGELADPTAQLLRLHPTRPGRRDLGEESDLIDRVEHELDVRLRDEAHLEAESAVHFLERVLPRALACPDVDVLLDEGIPEFTEAEGDPVISISVSDDSGGRQDWFDLQVVVTIDGEEVPIIELLTALRCGDQMMVLPSGRWFSLDQPALRELRELIEEGRQIVDRPAGTLAVHRFDVAWFEELSGLGVIESQCAAWERQVSALAGVDVESPVQVPESLLAELRPYQADGFRWLCAIWDAGLGGILADDMGLGKTVQTLAMLERARVAGELTEPVLVVAPTSVMSTWASEAERFAPGLRVVTAGRTSAKRRTSVAELAEGADLVITSYAVLRLDAERFREVAWRAVLLDEAHMVKNHQSKTYLAVRRLVRPVTIALTGTPVENGLMDLWSLLSLTAPGLYPRPDEFKRDWRKPIEAGDGDRLALLRRRIRPLMLRRTKDEVALDLPPKQVQVLPIELAPAHRRIYDRHFQRERQRVLGLLEDPEANRVEILASLTRLRQLALDVVLVDPDGPAAPSAKIETVLGQIEELAQEGHRALVFSQFTRFLGRVRERLEAAGIATCYLDGSTRRRDEVIEEFRSGDAPVFLISLKAGGVGLTLTEADYVFVLDPWWNPAAESQAIDRAHRIGQDKPVMVYRLVSTGTIEDKVVALQERKRDLFARVVDDDPLTGGLTADDLRSLLE
ncbi:SNF2-related protein [Actinomycetota bacterium]